MEILASLNFCIRPLYSTEDFFLVLATPCCYNKDIENDKRNEALERHIFQHQIDVIEKQYFPHHLGTEFCR